MADDKDWRVQVRLDGRRDAIVKRLRAHEEVLGTRVSPLPPGVELTDRGETLFAYASTKAVADAARSAIDRELRALGHTAELRVCCWDAAVGEWRQVEPPLVGVERELDEARAAAATRHVTQMETFAVGRAACAAVAAEILDRARQRGIECDVVEERHLLGVRLTCTASGPAFELAGLFEYARRLIGATREGGVAGAGP